MIINHIFARAHLQCVCRVSEAHFVNFFFATQTHGLQNRASDEEVSRIIRGLIKAIYAKSMNSQ